MNNINEKEAARVLTLANNTIKIVKAIREGLTPNEIVQRVGCNYSVAKYYIDLLTNEET
jgi:predicted transcriptional regulator